MVENGNETLKVNVAVFMEINVAVAFVMDIYMLEGISF